MKLLIVSHFFPYPPINGGRQRAYNLIKGLARRHEVHLLSFTQCREDLEHLHRASRICESIACVPETPFHATLVLGLRSAVSIKPKSVIAAWSRPMDRLVRRQLREGGFDAALALTTKSGVYVKSHDIPKILDDDNVDTTYFARIVEAADSAVTKFRRKLTWVKGTQHEKSLAGRFDAVTAVSEEDRHELARLLPATEQRGMIRIVPNGVDLELLEFGGGPVDRRMIISTGALTYQANMDAAIFFCRRILPRIKAVEPDVRFVITGDNQGVDIGPLVEAGAELTGFLPDVRPIVAESAALVAPLRIGGGTRLKILEAMALGTPVVSTEIGACGLGLVDKETAMLADDPEGFARATLRIMREPEVREAISEAGKNYVAKHFGWERSVQMIDEVISSVADQRRG